MKLDKSKIKKILVIKFGGMGDILLTTPVLPNLKAYFPDSEIYFLTVRHSRDILIDNPYITRAFTYDASEDKSWCLIKNIRQQKYDLVIDLFGNPRTALITFMSGAKYRFGFNFRGRNYAYNLKARGRGGEVHNVEFNLDSLRALEIPIISKKLYLPINVVHEEFADEFFKANDLYSKKVIGISKTGGWESKRYKIDDYIKLMDMLNEIYDVNFVLFWGNEKEKENCEKIKNSVKKQNAFLIPDSPIRYLAAIIKKCDIVIGNDSGPLHVAVSMEVPTLGIYGPTNPMLQGPFGENNLSVVNENIDCLYCNLLNCNIGNICMTELSKDTIIDKVKELVRINNVNL
ncbi:MAG TPA: glycosyltransferase family 9 protein [Ignavibacteria bacterium]|nr:glycosyltransferase family 9 protein [Ignavibacteria bacterium]HQY52453.1 glycosyltransferase family 9 protein [Ignavibacteria bacterium]HRB00049.1 glycosyltransferase family 9 protein [Ignavibacteria bacterium]